MHGSSWVQLWKWSVWVKLYHLVSAQGAVFVFGTEIADCWIWLVLLCCFTEGEATVAAHTCAEYVKTSLGYKPRNETTKKMIRRHIRITRTHTHTLTRMHADITDDEAEVATPQEPQPQISASIHHWLAHDPHILTLQRLKAHTEWEKSQPKRTRMRTHRKNTTFKSSAHLYQMKCRAAGAHPLLSSSRYRLIKLHC